MARRSGGNSIDYQCGHLGVFNQWKNIRIHVIDISIYSQKSKYVLANKLWWGSYCGSWSCATSGLSRQLMLSSYRLVVQPMIVFPSSMCLPSKRHVRHSHSERQPKAIPKPIFKATKLSSYCSIKTWNTRIVLSKNETRICVCILF